MTKIVPLFGDRRAAAAQQVETTAAVNEAHAAVGRLLEGASIEVMPRTFDKVDDLSALLPPATQVYVAHIDGAHIDDMRRTVRRLSEMGFEAVPHVPARLIADRTMLDEWVRGYADCGARTALVLAGGLSAPRGVYHSSLQLLETGLFDAHGLRRLSVAGHPEGNRDIDPDGSETEVFAALGWKKAFAERTDAELTVVTQFAFAADPIVSWLDRLTAAGLDLPVRVGVAGPAKLQTLIRFALLCGVGPSLSVLKRRAADLSKLLLPFEPTEFLADLANRLATREPAGATVAGLHLFPLGGIGAATAYADEMRSAGALAAAG